MRTCGDCQLCCKLVPVHDARTGLQKGGNERCRHQSHAKGCGVYQTAAMPVCCHLWSCRWVLSAPGTEKLSRPDRAHYVVDVMPDFITTIDNETGAQRNIEIVQVWVDPRRPKAHKDKALRDYLAGLAKQGIAALIRYSERNAFVLLAPSLTGAEDWKEVGSAIEPVEHSTAQIVEALGGRLEITIESRT